MSEPTVTQADRDRFSSFAWNFIDDDNKLKGEWAVALILAFARHRIESLEEAASIAEAINSGRGNEAEIAKAIRDLKGKRS